MFAELTGQGKISPWSQAYMREMSPYHAYLMNYKTEGRLGAGGRFNSILLKLDEEYSSATASLQEE